MITITGLVSSTSVILPNAQWGDSVAIKLNTKLKVTMSGIFYTYINTPNHIRGLLKFGTLTPAIVAEFILALEDWSNEQVEIDSIEGVKYRGILLTDTYEIATTNLRCASQSGSSGGNNEAVLHTVTIQFEGVAGET
ncbi:MAG: hypothetical protein M0R80_26690 [Proteobacteria bacterium]|jgi:hypothetical protein|nr:hypothetical protein [Pseudomonadota bacterium]